MNVWVQTQLMSVHSVSHTSECCHRCPHDVHTRCTVDTELSQLRVCKHSCQDLSRWSLCQQLPHTGFATYGSQLIVDAVFCCLTDCEFEQLVTLGSGCALFMVTCQYLTKWLAFFRSSRKTVGVITDFHGLSQETCRWHQWCWHCTYTPTHQQRVRYTLIQGHANI